MPNTLEYGKTYCYTWPEYTHHLAEGGKRTLPAQPSSFVVVSENEVSYRIRWLTTDSETPISKGCAIHINSVEVEH